MKNVLRFGAIAVLVAALAIACTKGGSDDSPTAPTGNNNSPSFDTSAPAGEPSQMDWARLAARLGGIAVDALTQSTGSSTRSLAGQPSALSARPLGSILVPVSNLAISASFICCGETSTSNLVATGTASTVSGGTVSLSLVYTASMALEWPSYDGKTTWQLTFPSNGFQIVANFSTAGDQIAPAQHITLSGSLDYAVAGGSPHSAPISVDLAYTDITNGAPTGTGTTGSANLPGTTLPAITPAPRCSYPREGCGPNASGNCPCTTWRPCPVYGPVCG